MTRLFALAALAMTSACTVYHHCEGVDLRDPSRPPAGTSVRFRVLPSPQGCAGESLALLTRKTDWDGSAVVDFAREEVVRVGCMQNVSAGVAWFVETDVDLQLGIATTDACTGYPPPPSPTLVLAIPLSTKPVKLVVFNAGPECHMSGNG
jgi:hypothetical protein